MPIFACKFLKRIKFAFIKADLDGPTYFLFNCYDKILPRFLGRPYWLSELSHINMKTLFLQKKNQTKKTGKKYKLNTWRDLKLPDSIPPSIPGDICTWMRSLRLDMGLHCNSELRDSHLSGVHTCVLGTQCLRSHKCSCNRTVNVTEPRS